MEWSHDVLQIKQFVISGDSVFIPPYIFINTHFRLLPARKTPVYQGMKFPSLPGVGGSGPGGSGGSGGVGVYPDKYSYHVRA